MVMFDLEEVVTIEREEWRSVEINSGGECVMMNGMKETRLLYADNLDSQKKVATIIHEIFVIKKFSFHPKRQFLTRILFTNSIIRSEYMAHT